MKFIFPQNYKLKTKIFGLIDYQSAILITIWGVIVFLVEKIIFDSLKLKIFFFIILVFPVSLFCIVGVGGENIIHVIIYMSKFIIEPKIFFYDK